MLKALYDYGIRNSLAIPPGFLRKDIRAYICLSADGSFIGIEQYERDSQICPDIGSLANGPDKCNPLAEKASVILAADGKKPEFYRSLLKAGAEYDPNLGVCLSALENAETFRAICQEVKLRKVKDGDRICFKVDGVPIVGGERVQDWWKEYRKRFAKGGNEQQDSMQPLCLITGNQTVPLATVPIVNGLQSVGGHSRGEALFCFDKSAFQSYGLKKSANAPVSEEAFAVVKDALNDLLAGSPAMYRREKDRDFNPFAPTFSGMKFLHWYDCRVEPEEDLILPELVGFGQEEDEDEDEENAQMQISPEEERAQERREALQQREKADRLILDFGSGEQSAVLSSQYYILLISGNNGRAMVRRYEHGSYETLRANLDQWREDLALSNGLGTDTIRPYKLTYRFTRLVKDQKKTGKELSDQMKKELAGITPAIVAAIFNGTPLPDAVAVRALAYIRSKMLAPPPKEGSKKDRRFANLPDGVACQWLKVWLVRKSRMRKEGTVLTMSYDREFPNAAYHCGALMAIYADLQRAAMGEVNATIVQRFYASASRTPTLVLGTLERMGEVYLGQLRKEKKGLVKIYEQRLNDVYSFFGKDGFRQLPAALNLEEQSYFALGYRQMCTQMNADKSAAKAAKEEETENGRN
ncbi:MAG: type I-C CRISPR-associated protein Cas8c/Csd1 [Oscillospiraceae bacterium]|nr:type I-C CRISPR-associated protein Cas8c/Csd1 [Oscillospiraceae bacterium]